jgi:hypothetical protein
VSDLEAIEARRAARKEALQQAHDAQRVKDLEAIDALEIEHGDSNIATLEVPYTPDLPTMIAVRCPKPVEVKRYRDRVKPKKDGSPGDSLGGALELAAVCRVYPDADTYAALLEARPGVDAQLGLLAIQLSAGKAEAAGKG